MTRAQLNLLITLANQTDPPLAPTLIATRVKLPLAVVVRWIERGSLHGAPDIEGHAQQHAPWHDVLGTDEETGHTQYGPERNPLSPRTGRAAAQDSTEREHGMSFDGIRTEKHGGGGLWDYSQEAAMGPRRLNADHNQKVAEGPAMARYVEKAGLTPRMFAIYTWYWNQGMSRGQIATRLGCKADQIDKVVKLLRRRLRDSHGQ
jgi:hypothetical protein